MQHTHTHNTEICVDVCSTCFVFVPEVTVTRGFRAHVFRYQTRAVSRCRLWVRHCGWVVAFRSVGMSLRLQQKANARQKQMPETPFSHVSVCSDVNARHNEKVITSSDRETFCIFSQQPEVTSTRTPRLHRKHWCKENQEAPIQTRYRPVSTTLYSVDLTLRGVLCFIITIIIIYQYILIMYSVLTLK